MSKKQILAALFLVAFNLSANAGIKISNVAPSGQTLWFEIENDHAVVAPPRNNTSEPGVATLWDGYVRPSGVLIIPSSVTYEGNTYPVTAIHNSTFSLCHNLKSVVVPSSVTSIGEYAFSQCDSLQSVDFGGTIDTLGHAICLSCSSLVSVTGIESVRTIELGAFSGCSALQYINLPMEIHTIGQSAFEGCSSLVSMVLPDSLTAIAGSLFENCSSLMSVIIPDAVTSIGYQAFSSCSSLTSIVLGDNVTTIDTWAFSPCANLNTVVIGSGISYIGEFAFLSCNNLSTIVIRATTPPSVGYAPFSGLYNTAYVYPPCGSIAAYQTATNWSQFTHYGCGIIADIHSSNPQLGNTTGFGVYDTTTDIILNALPAFGCMFYGWSNGVHDNPYTLHLTGDTTVAALFYPVDSNVIVTVHDTVSINVPVHDTTIVTEFIHDTTTVIEYIEVHDTVWQATTDTVWLTEYIHDTITIHDTVYVGIDGVDALDAKIYSNSGQIVVECAEQNTVTLLDINGRVLATKQDCGAPLRFDVPATGTYMVKIGRHVARKIVVVN